MALLERDAEADVLRRAVARTARGCGAGVAVVGEAGAGKSALVAAACAAAGEVRVIRAACDPLGTPRPLGPFRDVADELGLGSLLADTAPTLASLGEAAYRSLGTARTVFVVEDLHWIDAASAEVLRFLVRRIETIPLTLVVTYRDETIDSQHSARPLLGDFAALDDLATVRLLPLSEGAVAELVAGTGLAPGTVHALTGGNPFFVVEVAKEPGRPLPATVRDAVLARTARMDAGDFEVLQLAAAAPGRLDDRLLPALHVDLPTLRRLHDSGLLLRDRGGLSFRHELARLAVESTIPAGGAAHLHARLVAALEHVEPRDLAVLTHHAVAARDGARAVRYAEAAALEAIRAGSHTEAVAFLETALAHLHPPTPAHRARLLALLAQELYMTNRLDAALATVGTTFGLWEEAADPVGLAAAHESYALYQYYSARRPQAEAHAERAATITSGLPAQDAQLKFGQAQTTRSYLAVQNGDFALVQQCQSDADAIARRHRSAALATRVGLFTAVSDLAQGDAAARPRLVDLIEEARATGLDELASTGYSNLANLDVEQRRPRSAEHVLEEALAFSSERDIPICRFWQTGVRSRLRLEQGRWEAALEDAAAVLDRSGMPLAALWPHVVSGLVALRRGEDGGSHLEQAWELSGRLDEPLRRLPVLSALAERAWLTGARDDRVAGLAVAAVHDLAGAPGATWGVGDLAVWLVRLGLLPDPPADAVAEPYRLTLSGRPAAAAAWWRELGCEYDAALALADSPAVEHRVSAVEALDLLGAVAVADRLRQEMREDGLPHVPQRPRASTRVNPAGLTNRQLEVAKLVARGFTNAEIASRLFISPKTADHHVSAVLAKLGLPNRRAVVVQADELGLS
ncbi:LuxR family transcriptional regulator [Nocardioides sp. GY 10113]|uniref:helix-turn-helix transcriptional regulator n=1 Tax=Nocardioides sp. GY 10113 TaxID=2569761 RepID=UPI0010A76598|nr:AAA family ATPase [Nocardioides sp. GY 10113]TIC87614.1 LuxR family transcriptional regulator [Nocardioides sp. GY 10113]